MSSRGLIVALCVSLTVNVFVVGTIVGAGVMRHRFVEQRARPPQPGNPMLRFADRLPEDVRDPYIARLRQEAQAGRPQMQAAREARMEAAKIIGAETYDPAAAAAALDRARTAETTARAAMENAVVEAAKGMKQADRQIIAQSLRAPQGPGGRGRGGPGGGGRRGGFGPGGPGGGPDGGFGPPRDGPPPIEIVPPPEK